MPKFRHGWRLFQVLSTHYVPCDESGEPVTPHEISPFCKCSPAAEATEDDDAVIWTHNEIH